MNREPTFVDTWGWLALGYRRDANHAEVTSLFRSIRSSQIPIHTSDYVLDELITLLHRRETHDEAIRFEESSLSAARIGQQHEPKTSWMRRFVEMIASPGKPTAFVVTFPLNSTRER